MSNGASALPSWQSAPGTGTVTSVSGSGGTTGLTLTGGAITTSGTLTLGGTLIVANGGTGNASTTAFAVQCGGTTSTGAHQAVSGVGTSGQILTSNGTAALPTWQAVPAPTPASITYATSEPSDGSLSTGQGCIWFDPTGNTVNFKLKNISNVIKKASINLT